MYTRCLEPFEEEDRDEDDEQPIIPSFSQCAGDLSETSVNASSSSLQHQNSEAESTPPGNSLSYHPLVNVLVTSQRPLLMQVPRHCSIKTVKLNPHPQGNYLSLEIQCSSRQKWRTISRLIIIKL